jgi:hypothetical protein
MPAPRGYKRKKLKSWRKFCAPGSIRTILSGKARVLVCCPRSHWKRGRCKVGMRAVSLDVPRSFGDVRVSLPKSAYYALELDNSGRWPGLERVKGRIYTMPDDTAHSLLGEAKIRGMSKEASGYDLMSAKDRAGARIAAKNLSKALGK